MVARHATAGILMQSVPQAIVNAVLDAFSPWGVEDLDTPLQPARVWEAIQRAGLRESRR